jgi:hypothetical protein
MTDLPQDPNFQTLLSRVDKEDADIAKLRELNASSFLAFDDLKKNVIKNGSPIVLTQANGQVQGPLWIGIGSGT